MSLAKIALGWEAYNAVAAPNNGRLLINSGGTVLFMWDVTPGYPNWGYTQNTVTENEKLVHAALKWLTGMATGQNILKFVPVGQIGDTPWDTFAMDTMTRSPSASGSQMYGSYGPWNYGGGCGATITEATPSSLLGWTNTNWGGYNPFDYDVVLLYHTYRSGTGTGTNEEIDYYLANNGKIWTYYGYADSDRWSAYGATHGAGSVSGPPPDYMPTAVAVPPFGAGTYRHGVYTSPPIVFGTNTMGGHAETFGQIFHLWWL